VSDVIGSERSSSLEAKVASELSALVKDVAIGAEFPFASNAAVCYALELFLPALLRVRFAEWKRESLDGFRIASARKVGPSAVELAGICILISDQTVTPFCAHLVVSPDTSSISAYRVRVGEAGHGPLGISGPDCNSSGAKRLLDGLMARMESVRWVYSVDSLQSPGDAGERQT
jgi:hypothetical protein